MFQRAGTVNSLILSRWWFNGGVVKLSENLCRVTLNQLKCYIYQKCDEKPRECVNFRRTQDGGLGLHHPLVKHQSLLVRSQLRQIDFQEREVASEQPPTVRDHPYSLSSSEPAENTPSQSSTHAILPSFSDFPQSLDHNYGTPSHRHAGVSPESDVYGYRALHDLVDAELGSGPHRANRIYNLLVKPLIKERDEFKPSRSEEKWPELNWKQVWQN